VVVSTGGVSAGDSDWIRPLLGELGSVSFWKLFLKPGRPFAFGTLGGKPFFGLPGNPVAAAITALQLALAGPAGPRRFRPPAPAPAAGAAGTTDEQGLRPAGAGPGPTVGGQRWIPPLALVEGSQASSRIGSLQGADLLLEIPAEAGTLAAGTELWAQLLRLPIF
jgi:molybdopterin molybdotransferase